MVRQLLICSSKGTEKESIGALVLMGRFGCQFQNEIRTALIPLLECRDKRIHDDVVGWLKNIDGQINLMPESHYREAISKQKAAPPPGVVDYVFDLDPSKALLMLGSLYAVDRPPGFLRPLSWSDHIITVAKWRAHMLFLKEGDLEQARKEMDALSKHEGWYARRYVVEMMRANPTLGTPEIRDRLRKDTNPLVSEAAKKIK